jgi:lysophospholipase L1-like esterase
MLNHPDMKRILCFGDSNTWGYVPASAVERFPADVRWTGVMRAKLGDGFEVIEEAQNGRTTVFDDPYEVVCKNGAKHLPVILESQKPVDLVIVMLGTNDLKTHLGQTAPSIAGGAGVLVDRILTSDAGLGQRAPKVLLVAPALVAEGQCPFGTKFDGAAEKSRGLGDAYQRVADVRGVPCVNAADHVTVPTTDCIHFDKVGHGALGVALADRVRRLW